MRNLEICLKCEKCWKRYKYDGVFGVGEQRLVGFKCRIIDRNIIKNRKYFEEKECPPDCKYILEQTIMTKKNKV